MMESMGMDTPGTLGQEFNTLDWELTWRDVLRISALGKLLLLLFTIVILHDLLAAALAMILVVGLSLFVLQRTIYRLVFDLIARVVMWRLPEEIVGAFL